MSMRQKFFLSTVISVALGLLLWVFVLMISNAHNWPIDLTQNHRFTLADQSEQAARQLAEPVKIWAFVDDTNSNQRKNVEDLLARYRKLNPKLDFELVDPLRRPSVAKKFQIKMAGPAVIEIQSNDKDKPGRSERVNTITEDDITNALLKLNRHTELTVHYLTGHGERALDSREADGMANFKADLAREGITLEELNLAKSSNKLPAECKLIMIAGPTSDLLPGEETALKDFLKNQGHMMLMLEPDSPQSYAKLVAEYGINAPAEVVIDEASQLIGAEPIYALGLHFDPEHPITKSFRVNVVFRVARPILAAAPAPAGVNVTQLCLTEKTAFTVPAADFIGKTRFELPPNPEHKGISLAVAATMKKAAATPPPTPGADQKEPETRIVTVGDADFVSNHLFKQSGNRDFSLNMVNWLTQTENQITIRPRDAATEPLRMTQSDLNWMMLWHVLLIPGAVACMGVLTVVLRRR